MLMCSSHTHTKNVVLTKIVWFSVFLQKKSFPEEKIPERNCNCNCKSYDDIFNKTLVIYVYIVLFIYDMSFQNQIIVVSILLRLDFQRLMLAQPETVDNKCQYDQFIVSGGNPIPAICGTNDGLHGEIIICT